MARRGFKIAILAFLQGREAVAGVAEMAEDAYAEACAELKQQAEKMAEASAPGAAHSASEATKREITFEPKSRHQ